MWLFSAWNSSLFRCWHTGSSAKRENIGRSIFIRGQARLPIIYLSLLLKKTLTAKGWVSLLPFGVTSLKGFQHHFKTCLLWLLLTKECSFYYYLFCCTEMRFQVPFKLQVQILVVASNPRSELNKSKCEWTKIWTTLQMCCVSLVLAPRPRKGT